MPPAWDVFPVYLHQFLRVWRGARILLTADDLFEAYRHTPIYRSHQRYIPHEVLTAEVERDSLWSIGRDIRADRIYLFAQIAAAYLAVRGRAIPVWDDPDYDRQATVYVLVNTTESGGGGPAGDGGGPPTAAGTAPSDSA